MRDVVVLGGGVVGLASALLLTRDGLDVTLLEQDPSPPPAPEQAWPAWQRRGVPQFRQAHTLLPLFQRVLDQELPDVSARLVEAGCRWTDPLASPPPSIPDQRRRPGDERFRSLAGRRPLVEAVFAEAADDELGLRVRRGAAVEALLLDDARHVRGVRTRDGTEHLADLVVDATGRGSPVVRWLAAAGAAPVVEQHDRGFVYYTRFFRGELPPLLAPPLSPLGSISLLTLPGDGDTWSVTVFGTSRDHALKQARHAGAFTRLVRAHPRHAHWLEGEPVTDVLATAGVLDRHRRLVVDDEPVVTGLLPVGDAWACTNPSAGRGLSVGLAHAQLLRDVVRAHERADADLVVDGDARTEARLGPFVREQLRTDDLRVAEMEAHRDGSDVPAPDPATTRLVTAAARDGQAFRALLDTVACLASTPEVLARPDVADAVARLGSDEPDPLPGPSRAELVALLQG